LSVNFNVPEEVRALVVLLVAYLAVGYLLSRWGSKRLDVGFDGLVLVIRTRRFNALIERLGSRYRKALKVFSMVSVAAIVALMAFGVYVLHDNLYKLMFRRGEASPFMPVIPGVTLGLEALPYFAVGAFVVLVTHELAHGVVAVSEGIPVRSSGLFAAFVLFGGFVEPSEEDMAKSSLLSKLRVLSVGSVANYLAALLAAATFSLLFAPAPGVMVEGTVEGYPAHGVLATHDVIVSINGTPVRGVDDLSAFMARTRPGDVVELVVLRGSGEAKVSIRLAPDPRNSSKGFMGVKLAQRFTTRIPLPPHSAAVLSYYAYRAFNWVVILCASAAVINALPVYPFDGGQMLLWILRERSRSEGLAKAVCGTISAYFTALLVANVALTFKLWGVRLWLP